MPTNRNTLVMKPSDHDIRGIAPQTGILILIVIVILLATVLFVTVTQTAPSSNSGAPVTEFTIERDISYIKFTHTEGDPINICKLTLEIKMGRGGWTLRKQLSESINGGWRRISVNGNQVTSCQTITAGDTLTFYPYHQIPNDVTVYYTDDGNSYTLTTHKFSYVPGPNLMMRNYQFRSLHRGYTTLPAPDDTPTQAWSTSLTGQGVMGLYDRYLLASQDGLKHIDARTGGVRETFFDGINISQTAPAWADNGTIIAYDAANDDLYTADFWGRSPRWDDLNAKTTAVAHRWNQSRVFYVSGNQLVERNASTGAVAWSRTIPGNVQMRYPTMQPMRSVGGGSVYITTNNRLYSVNTTRGTLRWTRSINTPVGHTVTAFYYGGANLLLTTQAGVTRLDVSGGPNQVWHRSINVVSDAAVTTHLQNRVAVVTTASGDVVALNVYNGTTRWRKSQAGTPTTPIIAGGKVYVWHSNGGNSTITAYNVMTGNRIWQKTGLSAPVPPQRITLHSHGDYIYVGGTGYRDPTPPTADGWLSLPGIKLVS